MAKRFNVYRTFYDFLSERDLVADELAVVNTAATDFPKGGLFCKGRLISKPQIPFAGVIQNIPQERMVENTTITNNNLYFIRDKNCFGIGNNVVCARNPDKLSFEFRGQYLFNINQVTNAAAYGLKYVSVPEVDQYKLMPNEDFEYYVHNRPGLTYRIVGNPDMQFCKLHTDYNLEPGDYLLTDGTILPLEYFSKNFRSMILGVVANTEYRSFLPFPIINYNGIYIQSESFDQTIINDLARTSINEHNGSNVLMSISRYMNIDKIMPVSRFKVIFPAIYNGYTQSLCKMYIPTVFEYIKMTSDQKFVQSIYNLYPSGVDFLTHARSFSTFANLEIANDNKDYTNIIESESGFGTTAINAMSNFFFLGHY